MQTQERNRCQDVVDGLYPLVDISRIQDIYVELIGTRTPPRPTGVIQRALPSSLGTCASIKMVNRTPAAINMLTRTVSVPSDVLLIDLLKTTVNK